MADAVKEVHLRPKKTQTPRNALSRALSGRRATQIGAELGMVTHKMSIPYNPQNNTTSIIKRKNYYRILI